MDFPRDLRPGIHSVRPRTVGVRQDVLFLREVVGGVLCWNGPVLDHETVPFGSRVRELGIVLGVWVAEKGHSREDSAERGIDRYR